MLTREQALENLGAENVEHRREAERLWLAQDLAFKAYEEAFQKRPREESEEDSKAHPDVQPLWAAYDAAETAWTDFPTNGDVVTRWHDDEPQRCVLTNLFIFEEDATLEPSNRTLKRVLVAALGLDEALFAEDVEDADDDEDEAADSAPELEEGDAA